MCKLKALDALNQAGMVGTDATTSLDTFIRRVSVALDDEMTGMDAEERHGWLSQRFGSDAVRAAAVLTKAVPA